jgi:hypothetical protein
LTAEKETDEEENVKAENVEEIQQPPNPKTTKKRKSKEVEVQEGVQEEIPNKRKSKELEV